MFDTHLHTEFSQDSTMRIEEVMDKATKLDFGIIITEHMDLNYHDPNMFRFDIEGYFKKYSKLRNENLLLGMEIGMSLKHKNDYEEMCKKYPFDYIIGSVHDIYDVDLYMADELYKTNSKKDFYEEYFKHMVKCIKEHSFIDSLGHIDYISRYAKYDDREIYYEEFKDFIDEVLKTLIDKGIAIELNTRRFNEHGALDNLIKIYKRFSEFGGKYVTIGSDAHDSSTIGKNFKTAEEIIELCNLKSVYFTNRKMEFNRIR